MSRILGVQTTRDHFVRPENFDLKALFHNSFGIVQSNKPPITISVRFCGPAAGVVEERIWHDSQRLQWLPSDRTLFDSTDNRDALIATFELSELVEFKRWLKGFGDQAVVLSPDWLRTGIRDELLHAANLYA